MLALVVRHDAKEVQRIAIGEGVLRIGRGDTNDVVLDHPAVSRKHAELTFDQGRLVVEDLDSGIGIRVGDRRVRSRQLQTGDTFSIGDFLLTVERGDGTPTKPRRWDAETPRAEVRLVRMHGGQRQEHKLPTGTTTLGRSAAQAQIALDDKTAGRAHASIHVLPDGRATIRDLQSTNGTFVNGNRVEVEWLSHGDQVQIGTHRFTVEVWTGDEGGATTHITHHALLDQDDETTMP